MSFMNYTNANLEQMGVTPADMREARRQNFGTFVNPFAEDRGSRINRTAIDIAAERQLQGMMDGGRNQMLRGDVQGGLSQMNTAMQISNRTGIEVNDRGVQGLDPNLPENQSQANQANALLNAYSGIDQIVADQAAQAANMSLESGSENPYGMADRVDMAGLQELAATNKMQMQNEQFMSDLAYQNAIRSRPISRDIAHQANDAQLAVTRTNARANVANALLNSMALSGQNWSNFYKMN